MSDYGVKELWRHHRTGQDKYTYFLLAAAASAVAFAIQKTEAHRLVWTMLPAGVAVVCWAASFWCGCKNLEWVQTTLYANYAYLQLRAGVHTDQPSHPDAVEAAQEGVRSALTANVQSAQNYARWQFRLLVLGAISFIGWHVLQLALLTNAT